MEDINAELERKDQERRDKAIKRIGKLLPGLSTILIIHCSDIGSFQFQKIRKLLRGEAEIVRGKVSHLRTAIRRQLSAHPELQPLLQHIKGEVGLVFTNKDIWYIKSKIESITVASEVKPKSFAPVDIIIPEGETNLEPSKTSFFQALGVPTKIMRGLIVVTQSYTLFKKGDLITASAVSLLRMLNMKPITKQVKVLYAYTNGTIIDETTLNEVPQRLDSSLHDGIQNIAATSVAIGAANQSSMMYILRSGVMNVRALSLGMKESSPEQNSNL